MSTFSVMGKEHPRFLHWGHVTGLPRSSRCPLSVFADTWAASVCAKNAVPVAKTTGMPIAGTIAGNITSMWGGLLSFLRLALNRLLLASRQKSLRRGKACRWSEHILLRTRQALEEHSEGPSGNNLNGTIPSNP